MGDQNQLSDEAIHIAMQLGKRIREYQIPAYVVESGDDAPLREIFDRINAGGKPLRKALLAQMLAVHPGSSTGMPGATRFRCVLIRIHWHDGEAIAW